jgi:hypothetical protein
LQRDLGYLACARECSCSQHCGLIWYNLVMRIVLLLAVSLVAGACKKSDSEATASPAPVVPTEPSRAPAAKPAAPDVEPSAEPQAAPELGPPQAGGLRWNDVEGLTRRQPKSAMRAAEYGLPDDPQAELTVFYFGEGQGGAIEANITRWLGQFTQPDGSDTAKKAKRREIKVQGMPVAMVEATGIYGGGMGMPGMAAAPAVKDAMLLAAIATGPRGPVFFKLTGSRAAVAQAQPAFEAMIQSLRAE